MENVHLSSQIPQLCKPSSTDNASVPLSTFPVFDLQFFLENAGDCSALCSAVAKELHETGIIIVRDPRVDYTENEKFLDMMESYFELPVDKKLSDAHPEISYQLGVTPNRTERARSHCEKLGRYSMENRPLTQCPPEADPKWRWFHPVGPRPETSRFRQLNAELVVPSEGFPQWTQVMDTWGGLLLSTVDTVARMAAIGFGLDEEAFVSLLHQGPHLLAPTGSDLSEWHEGSSPVFASFHYDLNFVTIHGRSRFPGLFVWTRSGDRLLVRVPVGCLLLQAGKQFEYVTGGRVLAGFHEVVVSPETLEEMERRKREGKSLWRISSTLFAHVASDLTLRVLDPFQSPEVEAAYPPMLAGDQVQAELDAIGLSVSHQPHADPN